MLSGTAEAAALSDGNTKEGSWGARSPAGVFTDCGSDASEHQTLHHPQEGEVAAGSQWVQVCVYVCVFTYL